MMRYSQIAIAGITMLTLAGCAIAPPFPTQKGVPAQPAINPASARLVKATPASSGASELVLAWPKGYTGGPIAYDSATGARRFTLPPGRADALGKLYFAAHAGTDTTDIKTYTLHDGVAIGSLTLSGAWEVSGVSPNGLYVAATQVSTADERQTWIKQNVWKTRVQIIDAGQQQVKHAINLDGNFEVETISNDGHSLFLLERLPAAKPDHYNVRQFDLWTERMNEYPLREKGNDEVMTGYAWDSVASHDGEWLMTLYLNSSKKEAFVHALHLNYLLTVCIDLPSGDGNLDALKEYRLTLSADSKTLYAANAALGVVTEVALDAEISTYPPYQVVRTTHFTPSEMGIGNPSLFTHSVFSPDGKTLYFTSANKAWAYDMRAHRVTRLPVEGALFGITVSADGQRVYVNQENALRTVDVLGH